MRKMSASVEQRSEGVLPAPFPPSDDALSELGDGSSSLSDIEDKEAEQDGLAGVDSENDIESDANDSEAETERLERSPHKQKDVVLSSHAESSTYERSPSKLQHKHNTEAEDDDNDADDLSDDDDDLSFDKSAKSLSMEGVEQDPTTATTSLENSSGEGKSSTIAIDPASKKRKRSLLPDRGSIDANDLEEPASKRTGSIVATADDYAIDDIASINGDGETSNPISGNISDAESLDAQDEEDENQQQTHQEIGVEDGAAEEVSPAEVSRSESERRKGRKKRRDPENGVDYPDAEQGDDANDVSMSNRPSNEAGEVDEPEDIPDVEGDEADVAIKNEEEQEKRRVAMDLLGDIERHFASFRDRLYEERLAQLEVEEAMLRQDKPTHPEYLAMLQCVDARRDEKLRIEARLTELRLETIERSAVAKRSQILAQFYQEVRDIREKKLEILGKQWYEIQHDRRGYGSNEEDYVLKFPERKSQQIMHQLAYNTEVSVLSGVAKYVGFPAAPPMASATSAQAEHDFEMMSRSQLKQQSQRIQQGLLLPELAALRAATSTTGFKPAEEQFIEQTPWANPQHPSHAHALHHQSLAQQPARMSSPFSVAPTPLARRQSHQHATGTPISGTFSGTTHTTAHTNGAYTSGGRISPMNPFASSSLPQKVVPSPLGSRQTSSSPQQSRAQATIADQLQRQGSLKDYSIGGSSNSVPVSTSDIQGKLQDFSKDAIAVVEPEQTTPTNGRA